VRLLFLALGLGLWLVAGVMVFWPTSTVRVMVPVQVETVHETTRVVRVLSYRFVNGVLKDSTTIMLPDSLSVRGTQRRNAGRTP